MFIRVMSACAALCGVVASLACPHVEYHNFLETFDRPPPFSASEYNTRCAAFVQNVALINDHNARPDSTYTAALNAMHDLPEAQRIAALHNGYKHRSEDPQHHGRSLPSLNSSFRKGSSHRLADDIPERNWWTQGRVTVVRNQGNCGDCWAESATAVVESLYAQKTGQLVQLSVQQVAECTPQYTNQGCNGGWPIDALRYVQQNGGLCPESVYPTTIGDGVDVECNVTLATSAQCKFPFNITEVIGIAMGDEAALEQAATTDVVSVAMDASGRGWNSYSTGVYNGVFNGTVDCSNESMDHAIVVTGYGTQDSNNLPFYVVRNSWGDTQWGNMQGYILISRGNNTCGIAQDAVYIV